MLLLWELWINKKITEFDASIMTQAAFDNGIHNRWVGSKVCGEIASTSLRAAGGPSSAKTPCQAGKRSSNP
jgi:hypothetical protein